MSAFIDDLIASKTPVTIYLINGVKLSGILTDRISDKEVAGLILTRDKASQLVCGNAIATILPAHTAPMVGLTKRAGSIAILTGDPDG